MEIKFYFKETYDLAVKILESKPTGLLFVKFDPKNLKMIFSNNFSKSIAINDWCAAKIWNVPSFKGGPDYEIIQ